MAFDSLTKRAEGSILMVPIPSECRESKLKHPAPWGGKGGNASAFQGLPWGIDNFHFMKMFGGSQAKEAETGTRKLMVHTRSCPQNHPCPSVRVCPVGALSQKGYAAPTVDYNKCTSCGKCSRYCFPGALVMEKR